MTQEDVELLRALPPEKRREMENFCRRQADQRKEWERQEEARGGVKELGELHARRLDARKGDHEFDDHDGPVGKPQKAICTWWEPADDDEAHFERGLASGVIQILLLDPAVARAQGPEVWAKWLISRAVLSELPARQRARVERLLSSVRSLLSKPPLGRAVSAAAIAREAGAKERSVQRWLSEIAELVPMVGEEIAMTFVDLIEQVDPLDVDRLILDEDALGPFWRISLAEGVAK